MVAYRNRRLVDTGNNLAQLVGCTPQAIAASQLSFYTGLGRRLVVVAAQPLKVAPWFAIVEQSVEETLAPFLLPAAALVIVGWLLYTIIKFTRVRIIAPLLSLWDSVGQMAAGQWQQNMTVRHNDELDQLAHSFNSMAGQLHQVFAALEDRIIELYQAQEALRESEARYRFIVCK